MSWAFRVEEITASDADSTETVPAYSVLALMDLFDITEIDLIKIDIEGAEYALFSNEPSAWIDNVGHLAVEPHEGIEPGVTDIITAALNGRPSQASGEYLLYGPRS